MRLARSLAITVVATVALHAQTTLTFGASKDNTLYESLTGSLSNGAGAYAFCGVTGQPYIRRTLVAFNLSSIPAGARVLSVTLQMNISRSGISFPVPVYVHRVLADWGEGTSNAGAMEGVGAAATTNDATWLHRFYPTQFWTTVGGDFASAVSATTATPQTGFTTFGPEDGMNDDVQSWLDGTAGNYGWVLQTDELLATVVRRFDSRENPTAANRPRLTVTFVPPGTVAASGTGCVGSNGLPLGLSVVGAPVQGQQFTLLTQNGIAGAMCADFIAFGLAAVPAPLYAGCSLYLYPSSAGYLSFGPHLVQPNGTVSELWSVPALPALFGCGLGVQSFALDAALPAGYVGSNGVLLVVN
jgi:hypothetical protein